MACQHFPDDQTLRLQAGAGEDDVIRLPSGLDRVDCERQEEEDCMGEDEQGSLYFTQVKRGRNSSLVVCWARCPA